MLTSFDFFGSDDLGEQIGPALTIEELSWQWGGWPVAGLVQRCEEGSLLAVHTSRPSGRWGWAIPQAQFDADGSLLPALEMLLVRSSQATCSQTDVMRLHWRALIEAFGECPGEHADHLISLIHAAANRLRSEDELSWRAAGGFDPEVPGFWRVHTHGSRYDFKVTHEQSLCRRVMGAGLGPPGTTFTTEPHDGAFIPTQIRAATHGDALLLRRQHPDGLWHPGTTSPVLRIQHAPVGSFGVDPWPPP